MLGVLVMAWVDSKSCKISGILLIYSYSIGLFHFGFDSNIWKSAFFNKTVCDAS